MRGIAPVPGADRRYHTSRWARDTYGVGETISLEAYCEARWQGDDTEPLRWICYGDSETYWDCAGKDVVLALEWRPAMVRYVVTLDIEVCPACGESHQGVTLRRYGEAETGGVYRAECPVTGLSIIMVVAEEGDDE